jgi:hypothetical protein
MVAVLVLQRTDACTDRFAVPEVWNEFDVVPMYISNSPRLCRVCRLGVRMLKKIQLNEQAAYAYWPHPTENLR